MDRYLNLLSFIKLLEKYSDEYELVMNGIETNYYPLSDSKTINVITGCLVERIHFRMRVPDEYAGIDWNGFEEICESTITDFYKFK